jgi:hypothetical protein
VQIERVLPGGVYGDDVRITRPRGPEDRALAPAW